MNRFRRARAYTHTTSYMLAVGFDRHGVPPRTGFIHQLRADVFPRTAERGWGRRYVIRTRIYPTRGRTVRYIYRRETSPTAPTPIRFDASCARRNARTNAVVLTRSSFVRFRRDALFTAKSAVGVIIVVTRRRTGKQRKRCRCVFALFPRDSDKPSKNNVFVILYVVFFL